MNMHGASSLFRTVAAVMLLLVLWSPGFGADPAQCVDPLAAPCYPDDTELTDVTSTIDAVRFLNAATFGANTRDVRHLKGMSFAQWLTEQTKLPASCHLASLNQTQDNNSRINRLEVWWRHAVTAPDQLRQRVAFALSQIFVVSDANSPIPQNALARYYDILVQNAFGNYRDLIEQITISPVMGSYLSMLGNRKANVKARTRPDENYAREIMQLFSIGLVRLKANGNPILAGGEPVPTYSQEEIEELARVFTGWAFGDSLYFPEGDDWRISMKAFQNFHDQGAKTILGNTPVAEGGTAEQDLATALDTIFNHPNVGPFIGKQLIQRLVTSNPSPAYVARVAAKFDDNGKGVRGDLGAVVRQVLLDKEALGSTTENQDFGKLREPVCVVSHLWRLFHGQAREGTYLYQMWSDPLNQTPLSAPSVFNFYRPDFSPIGPLRKNGLVGPEFQLVNDAQIVEFLNELYDRIYYFRKDNPWVDRTGILISIEMLKSKAKEPDTLVAYLNVYLAGGRLTAEFKDTLIKYLKKIPFNTWEGKGTRRVLDALYLVISSPYYLIQY